MRISKKIRFVLVYVTLVPYGSYAYDKKDKTFFVLNALGAVSGSCWTNNFYDGKSYTQTQKTPACYPNISEIPPAPTVCPPSRMANLSSFSMAMGVISSAVMVTESPGMTISTSLGSCMMPVTSVVLK